MEKVKKSAKKWLCISIALMLLSAIVVSFIQTDGGKVTMKDLKIETDDGYAMSCYLFVPDTATAETPAPAVVTSHGYLNNKEMQDANFVELARRGYVVLAIDQPMHGNSDNYSSSSANGVYQGALALSRMPFVDTARIGVTGHSMGGGSCNSAVAQDNKNETRIISAVLLNCADATYKDDSDGYADVYGSRDVGILAAQYDEFFHKFTDDGGVAREAPYFLTGRNAQSFLNFGADPDGLETRQAYQVYKQQVDGEEAIRVIYNPGIIHPWSHFSAQSTASTIEFFEEAFGAPNPLASSSQVWQFKEAFNFVGVIGFVLFLVSFATLMLYTPAFASLRAETVVQPAEVTDKKGKIWFWGSLAAGALFSMLIYRWILKLGTSMPVNQTESMGIGLWACLCGLFTILSMVVFYFAYGKKHGLDLAERGVKLPLKKLGKTALLAVIVAAVCYGWVFAADYFFKADFRLWTLAIKAFEADKLGNALTYIWLFLVFYVAASVSVNCFNYNTACGKKHPWVNGLVVALFAALPAIVLPAAQYITYFSSKAMLWPASAMHVLWLFPVILILFASALVSRCLYKVTKNPYLAGIISAIIITLITVTNTCTTL